jgi:IS605 OrfB family transposase
VKAIRTIKLKITGSTKADAMAVHWLVAANWLSEIAFKTKELNSNRLAKAHYKHLRKLGLTSQLACSLCKVVSATYRAIKSRKRWELAVFKKPVMPIVWRRDFNRAKRGVTLWNEVVTVHDTRPLPLHWLDSKLKRIGRQWYLILCYEVEVPEQKQTGCIVGVDFGVKRLMVATNSANSKTFFFHGGRLNHLRCSIRKARSAIQAVGTRSARRLLKRMSGHEAAVTENLLHIASKALVRYAVENGANKVVMEELSNVRDSSLNKGKDLCEKVHRWLYGMGQFFVSYKAASAGISVDKVNPKNTSRGCPRCGHVAASNRHGLHFQCQKCGHRQDADRNASENIRLRSVSREHDSRLSGSIQSPESSEPSEINSDSFVSHGELVLV